MSEKKSPPHKEKPMTSKPVSVEGKPNKRKLVTPCSPSDDDEKKSQQQKRKRPAGPEGSSPEHMGMGSPRGAGTVSRLNVPLSERQQMAILMRMADESTVGDVSPKSPSSGSQVSSSKRTPADKKVNKRNERGEAPLHMAAKKGDYKQTKRLLKAGASVNMKDYAGWTALHEACNSGNLRVARCLLKAGADVNVQGFDDDTPLHDASSNGHRKLVQLLLRCGANPLQANLKGKTAINVAVTSEIEGILRGNTTNYSSDSDVNSEASSSDSITSNKDDEDDFKSQTGSVKQDLVGSSTPSISSSMALPGASIGTVRRQSIPPSPDKMAASPRLFLKLQHKKSSSSSSSTTEEQQRVSEWNVLSMETGCEVTSEGDSTSHSAKPENAWSRLMSQPSPKGSRSTGDTDGCPDSTQVVHAAPRPVVINPLERTATEPFTPRGLDLVGDSDNEENSDVFTNFTNKTSSTFNNIPTCSSLNTSNDVKQPPAHQQQLQHFQSLHQQQQQQQQQQQLHIPGGTVSTYHNARPTPKPSNTVQTLTSSSLAGEQSAVSSSFAPSSSLPSHRGGSTCQSSSVSSTSTSQPLSTSTASLCSSSSGLPISSSHPGAGAGLSTSGPGSALPTSTSSGPGPGLPSHQHLHQHFLLHTQQTAPLATNLASVSHPHLDSRPGQQTLTFPPFSARGKGGGSIVTGLSDRAVAASGSSNALTTAVSTSASSHLLPSASSLRWDLGRVQAPRSEEPSTLLSKSDSSSCDFPSKLEGEESNPVSSEQGSWPSTPKVPPLKIIMPPKAGTPFTDDSKPLTKPALPYVVNPTREGQGWEEGEEAGQQMTVNNLGSAPVLVNEEGGDNSPNVSRSSPVPRPSSRAGSVTGLSSTELAGKPVESIRNLDVEESGSRESDGRNEQSEGSGERGEDGKDKRPTRTLRSHTAMLQQAQQKEQQQTKAVEKNGGPEVKEEGDSLSATRSPKGDDSTTDDSSFPPRKRKLRNKTEQQTLQVTAASVAAAKMNQPLEKPPNPYETYLNLRRQIASRHRTLSSVPPKPPIGFKDYLMVNCTYILQGNATSTLSVPMLPPPNLVTEPMREFFIQQEKERYRLRLQHVIEREKLMLSIEQEILREHGRAARALANQTLPFSVCTILREEEIYNQQELDQVEDRDKNNRSRYNGRQFYSWLQDVNDKYEKIKHLLLLRHHHEAESLYAVQKLDWEWKMKECGLCDHRNTPVIDDLHVPMVTVSDEFDLRPGNS